MRVQVSELRALANTLFDHLEATGHHAIDVDADFYWDIPAKQRYEPYTDPGKPDMGQLSDDWGELTRIREAKVQPVNYALVWLAAILRRIGEIAAG